MQVTANKNVQINMTKNLSTNSGVTDDTSDRLDLQMLNTAAEIAIYFATV